MAKARPPGSSDLDMLQSSYRPYQSGLLDRGRGGGGMDSDEDDEDADSVPPMPSYPSDSSSGWTPSAAATGTIPGGPSRRYREGHEDIVIQHVPEGNNARWSHIDDLDSFFKKVYEYQQRHGFKVMMVQECFVLAQFVFIVFLSTYLFECVNYDKLFNNDVSDMAGAAKDVKGTRSGANTKVTLGECLVPLGQCAAGFSLATWICILLAFVFWSTRAIATFYHFFQYWDIKSFYNVALKIPDSELDSVSWGEVQKRIISAQKEYLMCIHNEQLTELDIYHRILRFKNYMVAMVNKDLLPVRINLPFVGETLFLSQGMKFNLEFVFFKGPWAPFNQWHLKEDYKRFGKKKDLVEHLQSKITLFALVNFILMPFIFFWQLLYCFFNYTELIKREPGSLGVRKWSHYGRLYLRHFNELDHELRARLNRAYKPANTYMELFVSPMSVVIAQNVVFMAASVLAVFIILSVWDEDVLSIEHVITYMTALGALVAISRVFIPDENQVFLPEKTLTAVLAHIHYFPDTWHGQAHTHRVMSEVGELFPYTAVFLLQELVSPIVTPFVLYFNLRPKAPAIVDFFRNFTVSVTGVGDVCSFAMMDVRRHGHPQWQNGVGTTDAPAAAAPPTAAVTSGMGVSGDAATSVPAKTNLYTQAEDGKTEMSLVHFTLTNPEWRPPADAEDFISALRGHATKEAEALTTLVEENIEENALYSSINSLDAAGGIYSSLAANILQDAQLSRFRTVAEGGGVIGGDGFLFGEPYGSTESSSSNRPSPRLSPPPQQAVGGGGASGGSSLMQSTYAGGMASGNNVGRSFLFSSSNFQQPMSLLNSRMASTLAPPPNVRQDLRRLGLEFTEAEMSLSALYLHELHYRMSSNAMGAAGTATTSSRRHGSNTSRYEFQRRASLNELDEENLPLIDPSTSPRLASSMRS